MLPFVADGSCFKMVKAVENVLQENGEAQQQPQGDVLELTCNGMVSHCIVLSCWVTKLDPPCPAFQLLHPLHGNCVA